MPQKSFKTALLDAWDSLLTLVAFNLLWVILTILIVPAFPAYAGLNYVTNKIANNDEAGLKEFFEGFKKYFWVSWKFGLINFVVYSLIVLNFRFFSQYEDFGFVILQYFFISIAFIWAMVQVYVFPLLLEQDAPSFFKGLWNSIVIYLKFPARSIGLSILVFGILALGFIVPPLLILVAVSFQAFLSNWHTIWAIQELGVKTDHF